MNKLLIILSGVFVFSVCAEAQVLRNEGKMYVGGTASSPTLYIKGHAHLTGSTEIAHAGKTVLTGDFINDVTSGTVFKTSQRTGAFEFRGDNAQRIRGTASKTATSYIAFPDTVLVNSQHSNYLNTTVTIDPAMGASVKYLKFLRGRMVLDSKSAMNGTQRITDIAHLNVEVNNGITYRHNQTNLVDEGTVVINLSLGDNWQNGRIVGFASPFKTMYADYFLFNFLAKPDNSDQLPSNDTWIKDPKTAMPAGAGYLLGQGLVPWADDYYSRTLDPQYHTANRNDAVKDTFVFARRFAPASFTTFVQNSVGAAAYAGEELNTADVPVTLNQGYNFLGNPFTTPIDLSELFTASPSTATWGAGVAGLERRVYQLVSGSGTYLANREFTFGATYQVSQEAGSTLPKEVAPLQMFVVNKTTAGSASFTIPASKRVHGNIHFLRSDTNPVVDELLIETRDGLTGDFDRLCVVFRNDASTAAGDRYDAEKIFNRTGGVNQIYTRSSDNKSLITTTVPPSTDKLVMYFEPSYLAQEVTLVAERIASIASVPNVVLEDRQTGKIVNLKLVPTYRFNSSPTDRTDRFVLYFSSNAPTGIDEIRATPFTASYQAGSLWANGLQERWIGSDALVYDMLGRLVHKERITDAPAQRVEKNLSKGIYLLKISDDNTAVAKFVVK